MAEQFRAKSAKNPDLTLKEFALGYGVEPKHIRPYLTPADHTEATGTPLSLEQTSRYFDVSVKTVREWINSGLLQGGKIHGRWFVYFRESDRSYEEDTGFLELYHGTTKDCADNIEVVGFKPYTALKQIWFTKREGFARRHACGRAEMRNKIPVIFQCKIDKGKYRKFIRHGTHVYVFHMPVGPEVIQKVEVVRASPVTRRLTRKPSKTVDVTITQGSGRMGVLWWLNEYLLLQGADLIDESHSAVDAIHRWVDAQYAAGRETPISETEMIKQVTEKLKSDTESADLPVQES